MTLNGTVAIVTGSGRGLGQAYAWDLAERGARLVVNDISAEALEATVEGIAARGGRSVQVIGPVGPTETADRLVAAAVESFGRLDVLVANAGVLRDTVLWKMSDDDFDTVIEVHVRGTFTCGRAAAMQMRAQASGGRIIAIGSPTGQRGNFGQGNYAAAKAAIVGMVRTWAIELERFGITANAIVPVAATAMTATVPFFADLVEKSSAGEPLPPFARRALGIGAPGDVAGLVSFLASDAAAGITGQAIGIGGDRLSLWSHPHEAVVAFEQGGWTAEAIAETWPVSLASARQSVGIALPELPETAS